ncbi:CHAT domain-containing protein [Caulobacter sp. KR2-114]|uniref:CHAT domain-containing protein n=1 Tax=Caulobacter sp. KR2-114 TaxID=3400912 RepID=UPI003C069634
MTGRRPSPLALAGVAWLSLCGAARAQGQPPAPPAPAPTPAPQAGATGSVTGGAEGSALKAFRYNTSYWSFSPAIDLYRDLSHADGGANDPAVLISARIFLGFNLSTMGRLDEAAAALDQAEAMLAEAAPRLSPIDERVARVNLVVGRSVVLGNRAAAAAEPDRSQAFRQAADLAAQAVALSRAPLRQQVSQTVSATRDTGGVVLEAAVTQRYNLQNAEHGPALMIGRRMTDAEKLAELEARSHYARAAALMALGEDGGAAQENALARGALQRVDADMADWLRGLADAQAADLMDRAGNLPGAMASLQRAVVEVRRAHGLSRPEAYLLRRIAALQARQGDLASAKALQQKSFEILLTQTDGAQPTRQEVAPYLALLAPGAVAGDGADVARFFEVASVATETSTATTVADVAERLAQGDGPSALALRDLQSARLELDRATARLTRASAAGSGATAQQLQTVEAMEHDARQRVADAIARAQKIAGPRAAAAVSPRTALADLQAVLAPDEAYVRFIFLDDGAGYAVFVRHDGAKVTRLAASEAQAAQMVADLRASTQVTAQGAVPGFRLSRAAEAYQALFGALDSDVAQVHRLVIEPAGPLFSLQFAALLTRAPDKDLVARFIASRGRDYSQAPWLARARILETSVGSAAFVRLRHARPSDAPNPIYAFADPAPRVDDTRAAAQLSGERIAGGFSRGYSGGGTGACTAEARAILDFPPLPDSLAEASSAVAAYRADPSRDLLSGAAFTDTAVTHRTDLDSYRVLLFSTHAALPHSNRCWPDPFLFTTKADDATSDGMLDTMEIGALNLNANLVVLSACDTAAGDTNGQALGGLAQSFFFAGSRAVLVSHWAVNSRATAALISGVLAAEAQGDEPGLALEQGELKLMDDPELSHPYYWAAFALVGGARR